MPHSNSHDATTPPDAAADGTDRASSIVRSGALWWGVVPNLVLAASQMLLVPAVIEGRALDFGALHIDGLGLVFGVAWTLALAVSAARLLGEHSASGLSGYGVGGAFVLMPAGLLFAAYSRDLFTLAVGWEIAGVALWSLRRARGAATLLGLHMPGLALAALGIAGDIPPFVPPPGGVEQPLALPVVLLLGTVLFARSGCPPFDRLRRAPEPPGTVGDAHGSNGWGGRAPAVVRTPLAALHALVGPFLLAKVLTGSRWDAAGAWFLVVLGALITLSCCLSSVGHLSNSLRISRSVAACVGAASAGLGLAFGSPMGAVGGVALMLAGAVWVAALAPWTNAVQDGAGPRFPLRAAGFLMLSGGLAGVWAISAAASGQRYGLLGAALLPAWSLLALLLARHFSARQAGLLSRPFAPGDARRPGWVLSSLAALLGAAALLFGAVFPQLFVEWAVRPAVGAMAGGVAAPSALQAAWGIGLLVRAPDETVVAALPATGIALGVALALIAMRWLRLLLGLLLGYK